MKYYCRHASVTLCAKVTIDIDMPSLFLCFAGFIITKGIIEFLPAEFPYKTFYFRDDKSLCSGSFNLQTDRCAVSERSKSRSCSTKPCCEQTLNLAFARITISAASLNM